MWIKWTLLFFSTTSSKLFVLFISSYNWSCCETLVCCVYNEILDTNCCKFITWKCFLQVLCQNGGFEELIFSLVQNHWWTWISSLNVPKVRFITHYHQFTTSSNLKFTGFMWLKHFRQCWLLLMFWKRQSEIIEGFL